MADRALAAPVSPNRERRRPAINVLNAMATGPWAILPEKLDAMIQIVLRQNGTPQAIEAERGEPLDHTYACTIRDGVATIPIEGPMFKRADWFSAISGATSYVDIATDFFAALDDPAVRAIILNFDSGGGEVTGCSELARMIYAARGRKPIVAYLEGMCASAAYWLASACDDLVASDSAMVGNIGAVLTIEITKKQDEMLGIEHIEIVSSQTPLKRVDPKQKEGRAQLQMVVDELAQVFIDSVAEYRDVEASVVTERYAGRTLFVGASALEAGLVDRLGSYEEILAELIANTEDAGSPAPGLTLVPAAAASPATVATSASRPSTTPVTETAMKARPQAGRRGAAPRADAEPETPAPDPVAPAGEAESGEPDEELEPEPETRAPAAAAPAVTADAIAQARTQERERVLAIQALGRPGEEAIVASCVADANCTPAQAALQLRQAERTTGQNHLAAIQGDEGQAPAPTAGATVEQSAIDAAADAIVNAGKSPASQRPAR